MSTKHAFETANKRAYEKLAFFREVRKRFDGTPIKEVRSKISEIKRPAVQYLFKKHGKRSMVFTSHKVVVVCFSHNNLVCAVKEYGVTTNITTAEYWVRDVIKQSFTLDVKSIALAHHYPFDDISDLTGDGNYVAFINQFSQTLSFLGIALLDHFVIGKENAVSFKENKFLK